MNSQAVLIVVTFLAAATLALATNVQNENSLPLEDVPVPNADPRNAKQLNVQPGVGAPPAAPANSPDDLKAEGTFGLWGGWGGGWGGWGGGWGGWGGGWGGRGWGYRRPYGWGGWGGWGW